MFTFTCISVCLHFNISVCLQAILSDSAIVQLTDFFKSSSATIDIVVLGCQTSHDNGPSLSQLVSATMEHADANPHISSKVTFHCLPSPDASFTLWQQLEPLMEQLEMEVHDPDEVSFTSHREPSNLPMSLYETKLLQWLLFDFAG